MNLVNKICIALVISLFASNSYTASLDEITSYKKAEPEQITAEPYSVKEIIDILSSHINDEGVFDGGYRTGNPTFSSEDPRLVAFNKEKFGNCENFYINSGFSDGDYAFNFTIEFLFAKNESSKESHSSTVKSALKRLEDPSLARQSGCKENLQYAAELRSLLDSIAQATTSILEGKQKRVEAVKVKEQKKLALEKAIAKENAIKDAKVKADMQAKYDAETRGREENTKKLAACRQKSEYKLYELSLVIQRNNEVARYSQKEIDSQNEGAKVSGFVNKKVMYEAGNRIVGAKASNKEAFVSYKKLGGTAKTPETVVTTKNPCAPLENLSGL